MKIVPSLLFTSLFAVQASAFTVFLRQDSNILIDATVAADGAVSGGTDTSVLYTGNTDAEIRQESPDANFNNGTGDSAPGAEISVDGDDPGGSGLSSHGLVRFDLPNLNTLPGVPLAPGYQVVTATVFFDVDNTGNNPEMYVMAAASAWIESTVTWNSFGATPNDGIVVGTDTLGSVISFNGSGNKITIDVTQSVTDWYDGTVTNNGWGFVPTGTNGVDFDISEEGAPGEIDRPYLLIDFRPVPEPSTGLLAAGGLLALARRRRA